MVSHSGHHGTGTREQTHLFLRLTRSVFISSSQIFHPPSRILNQSSSESDSGWTHSSRPHFLVPNILAPRFLNQTSDESETERAPKTAVEASCVRRPPHLVSSLWTMATNLGASKPETHMKEAGRVRGGGRISPPPLTLITLDHVPRNTRCKYNQKINPMSLQHKNITSI